MTAMNGYDPKTMAKELAAMEADVERMGKEVRFRLVAIRLVALVMVVAALVFAFAIPAVASADPPHAYFENPCGRPFTDIWDSYATGHSWIAQWTGTDVARGGPEDGVWRLYAAAVNDGSGWRFSYYYWTSCYV